MTGFVKDLDLVNIWASILNKDMQNSIGWQYLPTQHSKW